MYIHLHTHTIVCAHLHLRYECLFIATYMNTLATMFCMLKLKDTINNDFSWVQEMENVVK